MKINYWNCKDENEKSNIWLDGWILSRLWTVVCQYHRAPLWCTRSERWLRHGPWYLPSSPYPVTASRRSTVALASGRFGCARFGCARFGCGSLFCICYSFYQPSNLPTFFELSQNAFCIFVEVWKLKIGWLVGKLVSFLSCSPRDTHPRERDPLLL